MLYQHSPPLPTLARAQCNATTSIKHNLLRSPAPARERPRNRLLPLLLLLLRHPAGVHLLFGLPRWGVDLRLAPWRVRWRGPARCATGTSTSTSTGRASEPLPARRARVCTRRLRLSRGLRRCRLGSHGELLPPAIALLRDLELREGLAVASAAEGLVRLFLRRASASVRRGSGGSGGRGGRARLLALVLLKELQVVRVAAVLLFPEAVESGGVA